MDHKLELVIYDWHYGRISSEPLGYFCRQQLCSEVGPTTLAVGCYLWCLKGHWPTSQVIKWNMKDGKNMSSLILQMETRFSGVLCEDLESDSECCFAWRCIYRVNHLIISGWKCCNCNKGMPGPCFLIDYLLRYKADVSTRQWIMTVMASQFITGFWPIISSLSNGNARPTGKTVRRTSPLLGSTFGVWLAF